MWKNEINRLHCQLLLIFSLIVIVACKLLPLSSPTLLPLTSHTPSVTQYKLLTKAPTITSVPPTHAPTTRSIDFIPSENAGDYVGEFVVIRIENAYCSYRPDVNGAPTFCNDQSFPNHTFTLITWGKDWTDLDGECIYIEGEVEEYEGKYEIIADSRDQVILCD